VFIADMYHILQIQVICYTYTDLILDMWTKMRHRSYKKKKQHVIVLCSLIFLTHKCNNLQSPPHRDWRCH